MYRQLTINLKGKTRYETLHGRKHLVAPATIIAHGVWAGSAGPIYYPDDELARVVNSWNGRDVVVYHPESNGEPISACSPKVLESRGIGRTFNAVHNDGKTQLECWLDVEKTKAVDGRVLDKLKKNESVEVSTGYEMDAEPADGEFDGKKYNYVARNLRPDHLAALPDKIGAYSVKDGGGLLALNHAQQPERNQRIMRRTAEQALKAVGAEIVDNELSFDDINRQLQDLLSGKFGQPGKYWNGYICNTYPDHVIFSDSYTNPGQYLMIDYTVDDDVVSLSGDAVTVQRVTEFRVVNGAVYVADDDGTLTKRGTVDMAAKPGFDKKAHVTSLIGNGWDESDRVALEAMPDVVLAKIVPTPKVDPPIVDNEKKETKTDPPAPTPAKEKTLDELIANASPAHQQLFRDMDAAYTSEKAKLITAIVGNARNKMPKEYLEKKDINELRYLAALAGPGDDVSAGGDDLPPYPGGGRANYFGAQGGPPVTNVAAGESLGLPDYSDVFKPVTRQKA